MRLRFDDSCVIHKYVCKTMHMVHIYTIVASLGVPVIAMMMPHLPVVNKMHCFESDSHDLHDNASVASILWWHFVLFFFCLESNRTTKHTNTHILYVCICKFRRMQTHRVLLRYMSGSLSHMRVWFAVFARMREFHQTENQHTYTPPPSATPPELCHQKPNYSRCANRMHGYDVWVWCEYV